MQSHTPASFLVICTYIHILCVCACVCVQECVYVYYTTGNQHLLNNAKSKLPLDDQDLSDVLVDDPRHPSLRQSNADGTVNKHHLESKTTPYDQSKQTDSEGNHLEKVKQHTGRSIGIIY